MFFDSLTDIPKIAARTNFSIFVIPDTNPKSIKIPRAIIVEPDDTKSKSHHISIDQVKEIIALTNTKQTVDQFIIFTPADSLPPEAQNAFLKNLEEPKDHYHYVFFTNSPSKLLPTILSRSHLYFLKTTNDLNSPPTAKTAIQDIAKKLISATPTELVSIADNIAKRKNRPYALEIVATVTELLYKSYFATNDFKFLEKIPDFLQLYENIKNNGHIRLHFVADLC